MANEIEKIKEAGEYSDPKGLAAKNNALLGIAKKVYLAIVEDGCYGPYALGDELWEEFESEFKDA